MLAGLAVLSITAAAFLFIVGADGHGKRFLFFGIALAVAVQIVEIALVALRPALLPDLGVGFAVVGFVALAAAWARLRDRRERERRKQRDDTSLKRRVDRGP